MCGRFELTCLGDALVLVGLGERVLSLVLGHVLIVRLLILGHVAVRPKLLSLLVLLLSALLTENLHIGLKFGLLRVFTIVLVHAAVLRSLGNLRDLLQKDVPDSLDDATLRLFGILSIHIILLGFLIIDIGAVLGKDLGNSCKLGVIRVLVLLLNDQLLSPFRWLWDWGSSLPWRHHPSSLRSVSHYSSGSAFSFG